jgi:DNA-binding SARP family transcriptional activator
MEFFLLGSLLVCPAAKAEVRVPPGKQRVLLAVLLLHSNHVVSADVLVEALWGSEPPPSARAAMRNYVKRLRNVLDDPGHDLIRSVPGGYLIRVPAGDLDVTRFEELERAGQEAAAAGDWDHAADLLRAALSLWRGEALEDARSEWLAVRELPRLAELRLRALETRIDLDLRLGRRAEAIAELWRLTNVHPLREGLYRLLMLALCQDGRYAEALAVYQSARRVLITELGTEPGPDLGRLHQRILISDPALAGPDPPHAAPAPVTLSGARGGSLPPRQLPPAARHFSGRSAELVALRRITDEPAGAGWPAIIAVTGAAGVGKTALALRWAHEVAFRFPDGQLHADLRGYDPGSPVPPAEVLARFLRSLGVPDAEIPADQTERAARFRSLLTGQRVLVVLDNARSAEHVRPLLPATPGCAVVVTSRDSLAGLVVRDGAQRLDLDLLPLTDAVHLLRSLIGGRVDADPAAARTLAVECAQLPLALCAAAELAAACPAAPLAELVRQLGDRHQRLDLLDGGGDPRTALRAVFSWSYQHLDGDSARAFRLLGLHPGTDIDPCAGAALMGTTVAQAGRLLTALARAHLIRPVGPARYAMHDLLRLYAAELAVGGDSDRQEALRRLLDHYVHVASAAMEIVSQAGLSRMSGEPAPAGPMPPVTDPWAAHAWLDEQRATLARIAAFAATHGWTAQAGRLAVVMRYAVPARMTE